MGNHKIKLKLQKKYGLSIIIYLVIFNHLGCNFFNSSKDQKVVIQSNLSQTILSAPPLSASLDFRTFDDEKQTGKIESQADLFFDGLLDRYGEKFRLDLTLISSVKSREYQFNILDTQPPYEIEMTDVGCPKLSSNMTSYQITLQHPSHYHSPLEINGNGKIICKQLHDQRGDYIELKISESFIAIHQMIPTAVQHILYPIATSSH